MDEIDAKDVQIAQNLNFLKNVINGWKDGSLTVDRIQMLENGDMRILPGEPPDTNGKVDTKDVPPLAVPSVEELLEPCEIKGDFPIGQEPCSPPKEAKVGGK